MWTHHVWITIGFVTPLKIYVAKDMFFEEDKGWVWNHTRKDLLMVRCPQARCLDAYQISVQLHNGVEPIWWHPLGGLCYPQWMANIMEGTYCLMQVLTTGRIAGILHIPFCSDECFTVWAEKLAQGLPGNKTQNLLYERPMRKVSQNEKRKEKTQI
jgi:hypothetical protein